MIRIDKTQFNMMVISILLILLMLFSVNEVAAGLVFIFAVVFALNPRKYMPYFMVLLILVYTDFLSLISSVSAGDFPIDFKISIIIGGGYNNTTKHRQTWKTGDACSYRNGSIGYKYFCCHV